MSEEFKNPNEVTPSKDGKPFLEKVNFNFRGTLSSIIRTVIDLNKPVPALGASTIASWIKAIEFKRSIEEEAYMLLTRSLIKAIRTQLKSRIDDINQNDDGTFFYFDREIGFVGSEIKASIDESDYTLNLSRFDNPRAFPLLADFKPFYKDWIIESFPISEDHAKELSADFPDYFAYQFQLELIGKHPSNYPEILKAHTNPFNEQIAQTLERRRYRLNLKSKYRQAALGEHTIALSDVYIEPDFWVYDAIFTKERIQKLREKNESSLEHFLSTGFKGSIHNYLINHFLKSKQSKAIDSDVEKKRMLILMGQPGHGKSSFCYRSMHDLLSDSEFNGEVFFVRLQEAEREILNTPLSGMAATKSINEFNIGFKDLVETNHGHPNVVFLDGLDEFFMTKSLSDSDVLLFLNNCKNLLARNKNLYLIITSRFNYVETSKLYNEDCLLFSLGTLSQKQQGSLVANYNKRINNGVENNFSPELLKKINEEGRFKHIKELIELPILLQMILISGIDIENAGSRAKVYDELFTTVLDRKWDRDKRLKKYRASGKFEKKHLRRYLAFLAYKIFLYNRGYLNKYEVAEFEETKQFVQKRLRIENEEGELKDVLKDILTSFYLKETVKSKNASGRREDNHDYAIEFLHKSLYEYLACEYLWYATKSFFLVKSADDPDECKEYPLAEVQRKMQELFALTKMTSETMDYMMEIVSQDTDDNDLLSDRMAYYLPKLLKHGFLYEYRSGIGIMELSPSAVDQSLNTFHNYWLILGQLNWHKVDNKFYDMDWLTLTSDPFFLRSIEELIGEYGKHLQHIVYSPISRYSEKEMIKETEEFKSFIRNESTVRNNDAFKYWIRRHLTHGNNAILNPKRNEQVVKEKEIFVNSLRLLAARRNPMNFNLSYISLQNADLTGIISPEINLSSANLRSANLRSANLSSADLSSAYLSSAYLSRANLRSADLRSANLRSANLSSANLSSANLSRASLSRANLSRAYLSRAYLSRAYLSSADLSSADLRSANLSSAYLSRADLSSADLSSADLSRADLSSANLRSANLSNTKFNHARMQGVLLHDARVHDTNWLYKLKAAEVTGYEWLTEKYIVSKEIEKFIDSFGFEFMGYVVLSKTS
ncbi:MAG: pentapeptide repeat-containing protein [Bacteroidota bacterium]